MYCRKCGNKLEDDALFCPECGTKVDRESMDQDVNSNADAPHYQNAASGQNNMGAGNATGDNNNEKINWREYLTMENIERFAPIAALLPIGMAVVVSVLGLFLFNTLGRIGFGYVICKILIFLLKTLFILAAAAATGGLVYVVVKTKNMTKVNSWIAPVATFAAFISCLGIAFGWGVVAWIFGVVSVVFGLELLARIVIAGQPMDSPVNPGGAFNTYKQYYDNYKAKYPTTKDLEKAGIVDPENSKFDGAGIDLFGYSILTALVCTVTCGIAAPWMICKIYKWRLSHTVINGKRLTFTGSGGSLLGHWILWEILTVITCGIYGLFVHVALRKWELQHTYIDGEPIVANGNESYFDGGSMAYVGYSLLGGLLLAVTCGLAYPWVMAMIQKWDTKHQVINRRRLEFSGSGLGFLGEYLIIFIFTVITCGIYAPWGTVRMNKYIISHTDFVNE